MAAIATLDKIDRKALSRFDAVIDVRSPAEYAEDHVPGAINLPVLSNAERAEVGTIYVQGSKFEARRIGAAYIARNVAGYLQGELAGKPGSFRPLLYCWRAGMRSGAMATILSEVGWRTTVIAGGYKTYRAWVRRRLYDEPLELRLALIDGCTGTGKTEVLRSAASQGLQAIDLEGLAGHRGSLLGWLPGRPQPDQKLFESGLLEAIDRLDPRRGVLVEAESSKVGELIVPPSLWRLMREAPRIELRAPREERVRYLVKAYGDVIADPAGLAASISWLPTRLGRKRLAQWRELVETGRFEELAEALIEHHYDPAYARSGRADGREPAAVIEFKDLRPETLAGAARVLEAYLHPTDGALRRAGS
jgi:tRNA 2-selenouridine synthase